MDLSSETARIVTARWLPQAGTSAPGCGVLRPDQPRTSRRCSARTGAERSAPPTSSRTTPPRPRTSRRRPFSPRFDRRRPFGPWLHRIVVNRAIDWARARKLRGEVELTAELPGREEPERGDAERLAAAIAALPEEQRAVIVLRHLLEYTPGEIAELLDLPRGTVNSRLRRGLDRMREAL